MALVVADRIKETTTTQGNGSSYTLAGPETGFESFSVIGNGNKTYYCCTDGTDFEIGIGTYTASGTTLSRHADDVLQSSNSDGLVNWGSGTKDIFVTQPAEKAVFIDGSGDVEFASGQTAKFNSNTTDPVIDIAGSGPNRIRFRQTTNFTDAANGVDLSYRTNPDDLRIERSQNGNIIAEFGGDDGHAALYHNNTMRLETTSTGTILTGHLQLGDSQEVKLGDDADFIIKHSGSANVIRDTGANSASKAIYIQTDETVNGVNLSKVNATETMAKFIPDGACELYHNNVKKLETSATGVTVTGLLSATTKSFDIPHPTKDGMRLRYGSLEGPENGVYVRGRLTGSSVIELPEHWAGLVHEDSITVQLTAIGKSQDLWVEDVSIERVQVCDVNEDCFYMVMAERKDVAKLEVEYAN